MFGDEAAEFKPVETKETKKEAPKKDNKKDSKRVTTYKLPLKVVTGVFPEFPIKAEDIGGDTITESDLYEVIYSKYEQFPRALTTLDVKGMLVKVYTKSYSDHLTEKKRVLEDGWRITLNGFSLPLLEGTELDLDTAKSLWEEQYPAFKGMKAKFFYDPEKKVVVPFIESDKLTDEVKTPATVFLFGQEEFVIEQSAAPSEERPEETKTEEAEDEEEEEGSEEDEADEDEASDDDAKDEPASITKTSKKGKKYNINELRKILSEKYGGLKFAVAKCQDGKYMAYPSDAYIDAAPEAKKEETYPTTDTQIGLIFTKIKLSPELFKGKTEVTKKEICKFLAKDYEEFADEARVTIVFDKARKLIKPMIAAARKGSLDNVVCSQEEVDEILSRDGYQLLNYSEDPKHLWRIEKTPIGTFKMLWAYKRDNINNSFNFNLPKIPEKIWRRMIFLFRKYAVHNLEVCCQLYYCEKTGYHLYIPEQTVGETFVQFNPAPLMNYCLMHEGTYLVADFHSHNKMASFFSVTDDKDEKRAGLFGVFGDYDPNDMTYTFLLRAGTQGLYASLDPADFFENWEDRFGLMKIVPFAFNRAESERIHSSLTKNII